MTNYSDLTLNVPFAANYSEETNEVTIFEYIPASERGNDHFWVTRVDGGLAVHVRFGYDEVRLNDVTPEQAVILMYEMLALRERAQE